MALQTGKNIEVSLVQETTFNTAPPQGGVGDPTPIMLRLTPSPGLRVTRSTIESAEIRTDGQSTIPRLGSRTASGSYRGELSVGTYDALFAAILRGTWSGTTLTPAVPAVRRSFTLEQYERDIDVSERFTGCRVSSMGVNLAPDGIAGVEFGFVGADVGILSGGAAPYMVLPSSTTRPSPTTSVPLVAVEAGITLDAVAVLDVTACSFTVELGAATQPVIGSQTTPDVFENNMRISGSISVIRADAERQSDYLAETTAGLVLRLAEPGAGSWQLQFDLPQIKFTDYEKSLGDDNAMIATIPFVAGKPSGSNMITITSTL